MARTPINRSNSLEGEKALRGDGCLAFVWMSDCVTNTVKFVVTTRAEWHGFSNLWYAIQFVGMFRSVGEEIFQH